MNLQPLARRLTGWSPALITALLVASVALRAPGDEVPPGNGGTVGEPIGCEAAVELVLAGHPLIEAARASVREAEAKASVLYWVAEPEVRLRTDAGTLDDDHRVGLRWPLPAPGAAGARAHAGKARAARRSAELDLTRARLAAEIRRDYAAARHARTERTILERLARQAREFANTVSDVTRAGGATTLERESALLTAADTEEQVAAARDREQFAARAVERWTGRTPSYDDGPCAAEPDLDDEILATHPEVRTARERAVAAGHEATATRREGWLWPSFLELTWVRESRGKDRDGMLLQSGVELPLPDGRSSESEAREKSLVLRARSIEEGVRAQTEAALLRYQHAREKVKRLATTFGDMQRARKLAAEGARAGADPGEVWRLAREITRRERDANQARYEEELARIEFRLSAGLP